MSLTQFFDVHECICSTVEASCSGRVFSNLYVRPVTCALFATSPIRADPLHLTLFPEDQRTMCIR